MVKCSQALFHTRPILRHLVSNWLARLSENIAYGPIIAANPSMPASASVTHMAGRNRPAPPKGEAKISCRICKNSVAAGDVQNHVGRHILRAKYGVSDRHAEAEASRFIILHSYL